MLFTCILTQLQENEDFSNLMAMSQKKSPSVAASLDSSKRLIANQKKAEKKKGSKVSRIFQFRNKLVTLQQPVYERLHETAKHKEARLLRIQVEREQNEKQQIESGKIPMSIVCIVVFVVLS